MKEIADLITNYGLGVICVIYMIYFQNTTMKEMLKTLSNMDNRLTAIETHLDIDDKSKKVEKKEK